jgi:mono/diheme cytochrome c family protein
MREENHWSSNELNRKSATPSQRQRSGLGCSVALLLVLVGLVAGAVAGGSLLLDFVNNQPMLAPLAIHDRTSHQQLATRREQEIAQLHGYGWVNKESGIAQIPIARAMQLVVEKGLPVGLPPTPTPAPQPTQAMTIATAFTATAPDLSTLNYQDNILPIFEQHCGKCHGDDEPEEGLKLTSYRAALAGSLNGPVIQPGDPDGSYLVELVVKGRMPKKGEPLSQPEIDTIVAWIKAGAPEK